MMPWAAAPLAARSGTAATRDATDFMAGSVLKDGETGEAGEARSSECEQLGGVAASQMEEREPSTTGEWD